MTIKDVARHMRLDWHTVKNLDKIHMREQLRVAGPPHQNMAAALNADIFFAKPYHAWERGLNENTNGLIRDFFPKGTDFSTIASAEIAKVERLLNSRPRKCLGFRSPKEVFNSFADP